ncbi:GGDEF domain-containing protein [Bacillus sp. UNCCL13]|nr:GGDEF domain-containing protein [Bacillus sp. UNCCL13]
MPNTQGNKLINNAFNHAPIALAMISLSGKWIAINRAFTQITGFTIEELETIPFYELVHPEDLLDDTSFRRKLLTKEKDCIVLEKRCYNKAGHIIWMSLTVSIVFDEQSVPQYYIVQAQDITERKQDEWNLKTSEQYYRTLLDHSPDPISVYCGGKIVYTNYAGARMVGLDDPSKLIGQEIFPYLHEDYHLIALKVIKEVFQTGKPVYDTDVKLLKQNGEAIDITVSSAPTTFQKKPAIQLTFRDNSLKKTLEETLLHSQKRLRGIFNMTGIGIALMDIQTRKTIDCNPALETYFGYSRNEIEKLSFVDISHLEDMDQSNLFFEQLVNGEIDSYQIENRYIRKDGKEVWGVLTVSRLDDMSQYAIAIIHDTTATKKMEKKLREANEKLTELSYIDSVTSIYNRRFFDNSLEREWKKAKRTKSTLSLILFDIDHFKQFNDTYGHQSGDECLFEIATTARNVLTSSADVITRYGGEEFAIILPDTDSGRARKVAEEIRQAIEKLGIPHKANSTGLFVTISLGVATLNSENPISTQDLILKADCALYKAKQDNRNCVEVFV